MADSAKAGIKEDAFLLVALQLQSFPQHSLLILGWCTNASAHVDMRVDAHVYGLTYTGSTLWVGSLHSPLMAMVSRAFFFNLSFSGTQRHTCI